MDGFYQEIKTSATIVTAFTAAVALQSRKCAVHRSFGTVTCVPVPVTALYRKTGATNVISITDGQLYLLLGRQK